MNDIEKDKITPETVTPENAPEIDLSKEEISQLDQEVQKSADTEYTTRMQNIDTKIGEINTELNELKKNIADYDVQKNTLTEEDKKQKEDKLASEKLAIEEKKKEVEKMLIDIKLAQLDQTQQQKVAEADAKLKQITTDLESVSKSKNFFGRVWERTKEHKKPLLIASGIGIGIRALTRLFRRRNKDKDNDNENENDDENDDNDGKKKNKKWFWNRGIGRTLKWIGIGVWGFLWIRRLLKQFWQKLDNDDKFTDSETPIKTIYETRCDTPPEQKTKYNEIGAGIDGMYTNVFQWEMRWPDKLWELTMAKNPKTWEDITTPQWMFPMAVDEAYDDTWEFMQTHTVIDEWLGANLDNLAWFIWDKMTDAADEIGKLFKPFKSFFGMSDDMFDANGKANDKFKQWLLDNPENPEFMTRNEQIAFILRKYLRVKVYLFHKELLIKRKLTAQHLGITDIKDPQVDAKMEDKEWKIHLDDQVKKNFRSKKLASGSNTAYDYLKSNNLLDDSYDPIAEEDIAEITARQESEIGDWLTDVVSGMAAGQIMPTEKKWDIVGTYDNFTESVNDDVREQSFYDQVVWWWPIDLRVNSEGIDKQQLMEAIWYNQIKSSFLDQAAVLRKKIDDGTATKEDLVELDQVMKSFYMLQKEVVLWWFMQNYFDGEKWFWEKMRIMFVNYRVEIAIVWWAITIITKYAKPIGKVLKPLVKVATFPVTLATREAMRNMKFMDKTIATSYLRRFAYDGPKWKIRLENDFIKGKISSKQLKYIINRWNRLEPNAWKGIADNDDFYRKVVFGGASETSFPRDIKLSNGKMMDITNNTLDDMFEKPNLRKILCKDKFKNIKSHLAILWDYDLKANSLSGNRKALMEQLLKKWNFKSIDDISKITKNIDDIPEDVIKNLDTSGVKKLAKQMGKNISTITDFKNIKLNATITKIIDNAAKLGKSEIKALETIVDDGIGSLKLLAKDPAAWVRYTAVLNNMDNFKKNISTMAKADYEQILALSKVHPKFKIRHAVDLLDIAKWTSKEAQVIAHALENLEKPNGYKIADLITELEGNKKILNVSDELIDALKEIKLANKAAEFVDCLWPIIKNIARFVKAI